MHELLDKYHSFVTSTKQVKMHVKNIEGTVDSTECNEAISDIRTVRLFLFNLITKPAATEE